MTVLRIKNLSIQLLIDITFDLLSICQILITLLELFKNQIFRSMFKIYYYNNYFFFLILSINSMKNITKIAKIKDVITEIVTIKIFFGL